MKYISITFVFLTMAIQCFAQSSGDTTIIINKKIIKEIIQKYPQLEEIKPDLIPDEAEEWIVTDRPHIAETPHLVPKGNLQWEAGAQFQSTKILDLQLNEYTYNTTLFRLGLSRRIELRIETEFLGEKTFKKSNDSTAIFKAGWTGINLASKVLLCNNRGLLPKTSLLYGVSLPYVGAKDFRVSHTAMELKFLFLNRINKWYEFEYNAGVGYDGAGSSLYTYAINNEFQASKKFFFFLEMYGAIIEKSDFEGKFNGSFIPDHRINGGIWYIITPNLQFDFSGGFGLSPASPDYYMAIGLSNRLSLWK